MNNEPVAWMYEKSNGASKLSFVKEKMLWEDMTETPLYTHPAKTLTDEEIAEIIQHLENAKYVGASKAADMLRQQQAEIELLKAELRLIDELVTGKAQEK
jgi:hypothetical protein